MRKYESLITRQSLLHLRLPLFSLYFLSWRNLPLKTRSIQRFLFVILQCVETVPDVDRASTHVCFYRRT